MPGLTHTESCNVEISSEFYVALAKAQGEFEPVHRNKTVAVQMKSGGSYTFAYAPLETILAAVLPALNSNGFALVQAVEGEAQFAEDAPPRGEYVTTTLYHANGWLSNKVRIIIKEPGAQAYGSALTFARRYSVTLLLGVCADEDDDANAAEGNSAMATMKQPTEKQRITPHGDAYKGVDLQKAQEMANKFKDALRVGIDRAVYDVHLKCVDDSDFYIAVSTFLNPGERKEIKEIIDRERKAQPKMLANGRAAPAAR